jgi:hypothetical protein
MAAGSTYTPIATTTLTGSSNTLTFSSIAGTYTDLVIASSASMPSSDDAFLVQFNSDTGSNYSTTFVYANGTTTYSGRITSSTSTVQGRAGNATFGTSYIQFQNYSNTTTYKTVLSRGGSASGLVVAYVGLWRSTAAITSIKLTSESGNNFSNGSTFTLYGIAAA